MRGKGRRVGGKKEERRKGMKGMSSYKTNDGQVSSKSIPSNGRSKSTSERS